MSIKKPSWPSGEDCRLVEIALRFDSQQGPKDFALDKNIIFKKSEALGPPVYIVSTSFCSTYLRTFLFQKTATFKNIPIAQIAYKDILIALGPLEK